MKGHIRERGAGNWCAVIDVRDPETGKRKRKWHSLPGCKGKREAQLECARIITEMGNGTYAEPDKTTVAQFLERWLEQVETQVSPRSYERYAEIARKNLIPALGAIKLTKLRPAHISAAYSKALTSGRRDGKGGLSPRSVHHMHRVLKQALKKALQWRELVHNPADAVKPPKVDRKPMATYDLEQTAALMERLRPTRMFIPALLGVLCGLRRGEIVALRWDDVKWDSESLSITQSAEQTKAGVRYKETKSGCGRNVRLSETVLQELKAWRVRQAEEFLRIGIRPEGQSFLVTKADGNPVQPRSLTHEWMRLASNGALRRIRFHDLRHSHATHLLGSEVHPKIASERLGHSKVGITLDLYSHVMPGMQEEAVARVDDALRAVQKGRADKK
jgi:integrase